MEPKEVESIIKRRLENIVFIEKNHTYWVHDDGCWVEAISMTKFIGQYAPPFEKEERARSWGAKNGMKAEDVMAMWDCTRDRGTLCHAYAENILCGREPDEVFDDPEFDRETPMRRGADKFIKNHIFGKYEIMIPESYLYSLKYLVAGSPDMLLLTQNWNAIGDWKFTDKLDDYRGDPWEPPLGHIRGGKYTKYSLQTAGYEELLCEVLPEDFHINEKFLVHGTVDGAVKITCKNMRHEFRSILDDRKKQLRDGTIVPRKLMERPDEDTIFPE